MPVLDNVIAWHSKGDVSDASRLLLNAKTCMEVMAIPNRFLPPLQTLKWPTEARIVPILTILGQN